MAVCAAGLRRYLLRHDALPATSLRCGVPVSLRAPGDTSMSNQVTMLVASLATDVADPVERMLAIKASMKVGKGVVADTGALQPDDLHVPGLAGDDVDRIVVGRTIARSPTSWRRWSTS